MNELQELYLAKKKEFKTAVDASNQFNNEISSHFEKKIESNIVVRSHLTNNNKFTISFIFQKHYSSNVNVHFDLQISKKSFETKFSLFENELVSVEFFAKHKELMNQVFDISQKVTADELIALVHRKNKLKKEETKLKKEFHKIEKEYFEKEAAAELSHVFNVFSFIDKDIIKQDKIDFYGEKAHQKSFVAIIVKEDELTFEEVLIKYEKTDKKRFTGRYAHTISKAKAFELLEKQISINGKAITKLDDVPFAKRAYKSSTYFTVKIKDYVEQIKPLSVSNKLNDF